MIPKKLLLPFLAVAGALLFMDSNQPALAQVKEVPTRDQIEAEVQVEIRRPLSVG